MFIKRGIYTGHANGLERKGVVKFRFRVSILSVRKMRKEKAIHAFEIRFRNPMVVNIYYNVAKEENARETKKKCKQAQVQFVKDFFGLHIVQ